MIIYWIDLDQLELTYQVLDLDYEIMITPHIKQIKINYEIQFSIHSMLKNKIKKIN
jgi:hypothetical protein